MDIFMRKDPEYQISNTITSSLSLVSTDSSKYVFIGGFYGGVVNIFNMESEKFVYQLKFTNSPVTALLVTHRDEFLICGTS